MPAWRLELAAASLAMVSVQLPVFLLGTLAVQLRESIGLSAAMLGVAAGSYFVAGAAGSMPSSRLVDRYGSVRMLVACCAGITLSLVWLGRVASSPGEIVAIMIVAGAVASISQPATNVLIFESVPQRYRGTAFGIKQGAIPVALVLAGVAVPAIALSAGWKAAYLSAAAVAGSCAITLLVTTLSSGRWHTSRRPSTHEARRSASPNAVRLLGLGFALALAAANALTTFLFTASVGQGFSKGAAGWLVAGAGLGGAAGRLFVGHQADSGRLHDPFAAVSYMICFGGAGYLMLGLASILHDQVVFACAAVVSFALGWGWNGLFNFAIVAQSPDAASWATGVTQVAGQVGAMAGPIVFGLVASEFSFALAWAWAAGLSLLAGMIILVARRASAW